MTLEIDAQEKYVDGLLQQRKQAALEQYQAQADSKYKKRERGLRVQPATDPLQRAQDKALEMRNAHRSRKREQTRSKIREQVQQRTRDLAEEFGLDPNEKHEILYDIEFSQSELEMARSKTGGSELSEPLE